MAKVIHPRQFYQALQDAGIIEEGDPVRRVVIDVQPTSAVVYIEKYTDDRWLTVIPMIAGMQVVTRKDIPDG
jgi:hypothetical protein